MADFIHQIDTRMGLPNKFFLKIFYKTLVLALHISNSTLEIFL